MGCWNMPVQNTGEILHPKQIVRNKEADDWTFNFHFGGKYLRFPHNLLNFPNRIMGYIKRKLSQYF